MSGDRICVAISYANSKKIHKHNMIYEVPNSKNLHNHNMFRGLPNNKKFHNRDMLQGVQEAMEDPEAALTLARFLWRMSQLAGQLNSSQPLAKPHTSDVSICSSCDCGLAECTTQWAV